jgi:hypothetical protein
MDATRPFFVLQMFNCAAILCGEKFHEYVVYILQSHRIPYVLALSICPMLTLCLDSAGENCPVRVYLYTELVDESIWQCPAFWHYAFFLAVAHERRHLTPFKYCFRYQPNLFRCLLLGSRVGFLVYSLFCFCSIHCATHEEVLDYKQLELFTFFGQLSAFVSNMTILKVERATIDAFLQKMALIGDVPPDMIASMTQTMRRSAPIRKHVRLSYRPFVVCRSFFMSLFWVMLAYSGIWV